MVARPRASLNFYTLTVVRPLTMGDEMDTSRKRHQSAKMRSHQHWAREFEALGRIVKLIPAQHVKPFTRGNKTDANDAIAIIEASTRPNLRFVPIKTTHQQDIQSLHRIRERLVGNRTGLTNQTRGLLSEYGIVAKKERKAFYSRYRHA